MEIKMKEKSQESNLLDFKLREMARISDMGFIKPHAGIHQGLLSNEVGQVLGSTVSLANNNVKAQISNSIDVTRDYIAQT